MSLIDIKKVQEEAEKEVREDAEKAAKVAIVGKLREIARAKKIVANLEAEYALLLRDLGETA